MELCERVAPELPEQAARDQLPKVSWMPARARHRQSGGRGAKCDVREARMVARYTCWYSFVKMHKSVGMTPAMASNVTDRLWNMTDQVALLDKFDEAQPRRKAGRKPKITAP